MQPIQHVHELTPGAGKPAAGFFMRETLTFAIFYIVIIYLSMGYW